MLCSICQRDFDDSDLYNCDCGYYICEDCAGRLMEGVELEDGDAIWAECPNCGKSIGMDLYLQFYEWGA